MASPAAVAAAASSVNAAALPSPNFRFSCFFPDIFVYASSRLPGNLPFQRNSRFGSLAVCFSRRQKHGSSPSRHAKPPQRKKKNAMISSLVHVTSLPRKKIIKWFEDKRAEDGVPDRRLPYERPAPDTVG